MNGEFWAFHNLPHMPEEWPEAEGSFAPSLFQNFDHANCGLSAETREALDEVFGRSGRFTWWPPRFFAAMFGDA